jgi:hypothetical protein
MFAVDTSSGTPVIGTPYYDYAAWTDCGGVLVYYGSSTGLGSNGTPLNADYVLYNQKSHNAHGGWSVAGHMKVKYLNHAGFAIGAPDESGLTGRGSAEVFAD